MSKCCGCNKKVLSNAVANNTDSCTCSLTDNCTDVCVTPQCGDQKLLTVLVPVIYDEIGINVCRTIPLATLLADYPTAAYIRAEVTNITFATGSDHRFSFFGTKPAGKKQQGRPERSV